jgi:flagellin
MVVQHNISAINANRYYGINNSKLSKSLEKLSSGYAINRAGDNAAGLAVSEKMRAQIAGINQGVTNAQDGISMIQTFEGALTETDSILQRMKTLATQSANGTYDNDVDRVAIQSEFDQLNDELNQIADTDYNGVIVLNGGTMADGTKAVNGTFNYTDGTRLAKQLGSADIKMLDSQEIDDMDTQYGTTAADTAWNDLFGADRTDSTVTDGPDSFEVTLQYNSSTNEWSVTKATNGAKLDELTDTTSVTSTDNGGFTLQTKTSGVQLANVVLDKSSLVNGDTITLKINNPATGTTTPSNGGATVADDSGFKEGGAPTALTDAAAPADSTGTAADAGKGAVISKADADLAIDVNTDATMTEDVSKLFEMLNSATVETKYDSSKATAKGDMTIKFADSSTADLVNDGNTTTLVVGDTTFTVASAADGITIKNGSETLVKLSMTEQSNTTANAGSSGTMLFNIQIDESSYDPSTGPSVEVVEDSSNVSVSNSNNAATVNLTYADNITLQVGARTKDSVNFTLNYTSTGIGDLKADLDCTANGLGTANLSLATQEDANAAIDKIGDAINKVSMVRGTFGAIQNRLEHKIDNLNTTSENLTDAESRIRDTDMAEEMMNFTKNQILAQASQSMLAQANQLPQGVLSLLQ